MAVPGTSTAAYAELLEKNRALPLEPLHADEDLPRRGAGRDRAGRGRRLFDVNGVEYFDGNSSLWVNVHGHGRPGAERGDRAQLERVAHSTLLGMANVPAIELAERLVALAPPARKVFLSDSGAAAVEIGLKVAFAYWRRVGRPGEGALRRLCDNGYHGDTVGSVSLGGIDLFHAEFGPLLLRSSR